MMKQADLLTYIQNLERDIKELKEAIIVLKNKVKANQGSIKNLTLQEGHY